MIKNIQKQVFKGGWEELQNGNHTVNVRIFFNAPKSFFMKPDGETVFTLESNAVVARGLGSFWDIASMDISLGQFDVSTDISDPDGLFFKDDGTRMYVMDRVPNEIFQYTLPIPWDVTSIVDTPVLLDLSFISAQAVQCIFSADGDFLFITNATSITRLPLPTNWDVTSFVPTTDTNFNPALSVVSAMFKTQGDMMYLLDFTNMKIVEYTLSTLWDITTATPTGNEFTIPGADGTVDLSIRTNGLEFFVLDFTNKTITKFNLEVAWDISTASFFSNSKSLAAGTPTGVDWKPDGTRMYICDEFSDTVTEFIASTPWNLDNMTTGASLDLTTLTTPITRVNALRWRTDGTRLYLLDIPARTLHQLNASTPYDLSSLTDPDIVVDSGENSSPVGLFFRADGKKMYTSGSNSDINENDLTTAWDITTRVIVATLNTLGDAPNPRAIFFKPDGRMLYFISAVAVFRYILSTPWSIVTAVLTDSFDISAQEPTGMGLHIRRSDGKKLFVVGTTVDTVFSFDLDLDFNNSIITTLGDEITTEAGENIVYV